MADLNCFYINQTPPLWDRLQGRDCLWALVLDPPESDDMRQIQTIAVTMDAFMRTSEVGFSDVHLVLINRPEAEEPAWERTEDGYRITLCVADGSYWSQIIYQLGWAMMHCLIDHLAPQARHSAVWAEELICEANALYMISLFAEQWNECPLSRQDPGYYHALQEVLQQYLADEGSSALLRCPDAAALQALNSSGPAAVDGRADESHDLYWRYYEEDIPSLAQVRLFANDSLLLCTHAWKDACPDSAAVRYVCRLQERIPGCDVPDGASTVINLFNSRPSEQQIDLYCAMMSSLNDMRHEHIIFDLMKPGRAPGEQKGLMFLQVCRAGEDALHLEVRIDTAKAFTMYATEKNPEEAARVLRDVLIHRIVPLDDSWREITGDVFGPEEPPRRITPDEAQALLRGKEPALPAAHACRTWQDGDGALLMQVRTAPQAQALWLMEAPDCKKLQELLFAGADGLDVVLNESFGRAGETPQLFDEDSFRVLCMTNDLQFRPCGPAQYASLRRRFLPEKKDAGQ